MRQRVREANLGGLRSRITGGTDGEGGGDGPVVILLHGFGASGEDLVPLAHYLDVPPEVRFVFPEAPLSLPGYYGEARAWWMIDMERLERDLERGTPADRSSEIPDRLDTARGELVALLDAVRTDLGVPDERVLLGGFSQGAMLSCDVLLRTDRRFAGLVLLSGTLIAQPLWQPRIPARAGTPVLQSHGHADQILPFAAAETLRDLLRAAGLPVEWHPFHGGHEIPPPVLKALATFIAGTVLTS
jgi:phospholipase/carboxylesterase